MSVSTTSILNKMLNEAKQAKETNTKKDMQKHAANVKLLCELLLDEEETAETKGSVDEHSITPAEMKAMIGEENRSKDSSSQDRKKLVDDDEANGESLFDF